MISFLVFFQYFSRKKLAYPADKVYFKKFKPFTLKFGFHIYQFPAVVGRHFLGCGIEVTMDDVTIIDQSSISLSHLMVLEALWIEEIKPELNTKDEFKSHQLVIKI